MKTVIALALAGLVCGTAACSDDNVPAKPTIHDYEAPPEAGGPIEPGRYAFPAMGDQKEVLPLTAVDVPAGFIADGSFLLLASPESEAVPADESRSRHSRSGRLAACIPMGVTTWTAHASFRPGRWSRLPTCCTTSPA